MRPPFRRDYCRDFPEGRSMIDHPLFFDLCADSLQLPKLLLGVELNAVQVNFCLRGKARIELGAQVIVWRVVGFGGMKDQLIDFAGVVMPLSDFDLPCADVLGVVEDMLEVVEIHERALEFIELKVADIRSARNFSHQPWHPAPAVGAGFEAQAAVDAIAGSIAQNHTAARRERGEYNLARFIFAHRLARLRIDNFNQRQVRMDVISG